MRSKIGRYGGWGAHGGGAFSGKDPTKVDRSAAYICRQMAKSIVKSGLSKRALVQLSYAIGVAKPLSLFVETYGTEMNGLTPEDITKVVKIAFDCRPGAIAKSLQLREPKYQVRRGEVVDNMEVVDIMVGWAVLWELVRERVTTGLEAASSVRI